MARWIARVVLGLVVAAMPAAAQMPDMRSMSGTPLPAGDLPDGTVSVRVVRGDVTNNVAGQVVELHGSGPSRTATTDEGGRAVFSGVAGGSSVHIVTLLDGARLESQEFPMPAQGGVKVMLVGGATGGAGPASSVPAAAAPTAPQEAVAGKVLFGGQSRIVVEVTEEGLDVYNLLDVANTTRTPVSTEPLVFELPAGAQQLTILEGSSPQAKVDGHRFVVTGPFSPGITQVQMAYRLQYSGGSLAFEQRLPADFTTTSLVVRKVGDTQFRSPQAGSVRDVSSDGNTYVMASGQTLPAGQPLQFELSGLPHHPSWPRFLAVGVAVFALGYGAWLAAAGPDEKLVAARAKLEQKRTALLDELVALERQRLTTPADGPKLDGRRASLVAQLERVYSQLDHSLPGAAAGASASGAAARVAAGAHAAR